MNQQRLAGGFCRAADGQHPLELPAVRFELPVFFFREQAEFMRLFRQAQIRVVLPEMQPAVGAACKKPLGFDNLLGAEVVDHNADVALVAPEFDRHFARGEAGGVESCHKSLARSLFVAAGAVDLSGAE